MPVTPVGAVEALATTVNHFYPDLNSEFIGVFDRREEEPSWINDLFINAAGDKAFVNFHAWGAAPLPLPVSRGAYIHEGGFGEYTLTVYPYEYATPKISWHVNDVKDSRAPKSLVDRAHEAAKNLAMLRKFVIPELLGGAAVTFLHEDVSFTNIFGGTGLYSNSHSYNGQTLDNIATGSGTSAGNIIDDLWTVRQAYRDMVNDVGRTYWEQEGEKKTKWTILVPPELEKVFNTVLRSELIVPAGATAPASNYTRDVFGDLVEIHVLETLSDTNDWHVIRSPQDSANMRPFLWAERAGIETIQWLISNSDESRESRHEAIMWLRRGFIGIGMPHTAVQVSN